MATVVAAVADMAAVADTAKVDTENNEKIDPECTRNENKGC